METIITNVQQFEKLTNCSRTSTKQTIDFFIQKYDITDDDLITDIYASFGIDSANEEPIKFISIKYELNLNQWVITEEEIKNVSVDFMKKCIDKETLRFFRRIGGVEIISKKDFETINISISPCKQYKVKRTFIY